MSECLTKLRILSLQVAMEEIEEGKDLLPCAQKVFDFLTADKDKCKTDKTDKKVSVRHIHTLNEAQRSYLEKKYKRRGYVTLIKDLDRLGKHKEKLCDAVKGKKLTR